MRSQYWPDWSDKAPLQFTVFVASSKINRYKSVHHPLDLGIPALLGNPAIPYIYLLYTWVLALALAFTTYLQSYKKERNPIKYHLPVVLVQFNYVFWVSIYSSVKWAEVWIRRQNAYKIILKL